MKKNEILSFPSKWVELENIILTSLARLRRPKSICCLSYADFRSRAKAVMLLDLGHTLRGEHIQRNGDRQEIQNLKVFYVPTAEELIQ
jgi:hypothetical protein